MTSWLGSSLSRMGIFFESCSEIAPGTCLRAFPVGQREYIGQADCSQRLQLELAGIPKLSVCSRDRRSGAPSTTRYRPRRPSVGTEGFSLKRGSHVLLQGVGAPNGEWQTSPTFPTRIRTGRSQPVVADKGK
jgi:hypothetical protein